MIMRKITMMWVMLVIIDNNEDGVVISIMTLIK